MCQDCFRSLPEIQSTLCITVDTVCVCVCVCVSVCVCYCLLPHPPCAQAMWLYAVGAENEHLATKEAVWRQSRVLPM